MFPKYNVIRWPDSNGNWWLVSEASETSGYTPILELHPKWTKGQMLPTYANQLWMAAELLAKEGKEKLNNPHAMIGRTCKCQSCFCCAAVEILREVGQ